jgi:GNAT superfamily N-acetyltransferase
MTAHYGVRNYEKQFIENIRNLWNEQYPAAYAGRREILFRWLTEENPFLYTESPYFLLFHKEDLVGMHGYMPLEFVINGRRKRGYFSHDMLLAREYRGKGLGALLVDPINERTASFSSGMWYNEPNYRLFSKSGWLDVPGLCPFLRIFDVRVFTKVRIKNEALFKISSNVVNILLGIRGMLAHFHPVKGVRILEIERFGEEFDRFFDSVASRLGIVVVRNQVYLNWKFVRKPFNNYTRYAAYDDSGQLSGYMITKKEFVEARIKGKILDIVVDPAKPRVFQGLIRRALEEFVEIGASYAEIMCTFPLFIRHLRRLGFIRSGTPQRFKVQNWQNDFSKDVVGNIRNWYLTYSDSDGDAWEVDNGDKAISS